MSLEIVFTPKAKDTFISIVSFIQQKWGNRSSEKFIEKTYKILDTISQQPYLFKAYQENDVRKGLITNQTSVVYRIQHDRVEILFFWDNRQDPVISD
jgi:plasmid stabilization system protein ParE